VRVAVVILALLAAAPAQAASVRVLVAGRTRAVERTVPERAASARVGGRRCTVGARTPLAALLHAGLRVTLRDYGACGRRAADAGSLFVTRVGADANRGRDGWVYKLGRRTPSLGAGDPSGRVRGRVLWFWCRMGASGCQRTLEVRPQATSAAAGAALPVTVRGYDDRGRGAPVAGATVTLGGAAATTDAAGRATLTAPARRGVYRLRAVAAGTVPAFSVRVQVR
jgi:hypothetical protein